jgi:hypothetical protein
VPSPLKQNKKIPRKPVVFHVFAVPDQGTTWLGFGLDGKLVAQKAAASLSSASTKNSLGATAMAETLRDGKLNGAWMTTLRGLMVFTAIEGRKHAPFGRLGALANKGETPIVTTFAAQPPSQDAPAGTAVATFKLPRAAIEDVVKLVISSH